MHYDGRKCGTRVIVLLLMLPLLGHAEDNRPKNNQALPLPPVTAERLLKGTDDPAAWLMYGGNYQSWRFSALTDINRRNVKKLQVAWIFQTGIPGTLQASPIVADGILYLTTAYNHLFALAPVTGEVLWKYDHPLPDDLRLCCGPANRGVALSEEKVFMATLDARLVALERKTGQVVWNVEMDRYTEGYGATLAPLVVKDKVIVGSASNEYGVPSWIDAYDTTTGERKWRRYTIPRAGERGVETWAGESWKKGGGTAWATGSYDPEQHLLFWAVGNPLPMFNGDSRAGDNLYTDSVLALEPETGEIKWHFQFTPHDLWDYDGNTDLFLLDVQRNGQAVKALVQPNRNGYLYVLDRTSGAYLHGTQYVDRLNWSKGLDERGRPIVDPQFAPTPEGKDFTCPGVMGGKNGSYTAAYSPVTRYLYVPVIESCMQLKKVPIPVTQGVMLLGGSPGATQAEDQSSYGHLSAIDPTTGAIKWRYVDDYPLFGGILATGGGLVFSGNLTGYAMAFDDVTGAVLWKFQTGAPVRGQPVTYKIDGRQYVAIPSGGVGAAIYAGAPALASEGSALIVFALPK